MPEERLCTSAEEAAEAAAALGVPVVLKLVSPDIVHKSDIGGVRLGLAGPQAVRSAYDEIIAAAQRHAPHARLRGVLVTPMLSGGVECLIGVTRDRVFGPVAMVALGGVFVEVLRDTALRLCPFGEADAMEMIRSLRGFPLLDGARRRPKADVAALAAALSRLSRFAAGAGPRLVGVEVNPILVLPEGQGAVALDAVVTLEESHAA